VTPARHPFKEAVGISAGVLVLRFPILGLLAIALATLAGCAPDYSPNTYAANAVQQANKVEPGVVVGYRQVQISASGTVGAVTGGAAGGILGSQTDISGVSTALGALGGTLVGGIVGTTIEHTTGDTTGWEYIVRKPTGELLAVTQREPSPIPIGQKVLVITGNQARVIADYSVAVEPPPASSSDKEKADAKPPTASASSEPAAPAPQAASASAASPPPAPSPTSVAASTGEAPAPSGKAAEAAPATVAGPIPTAAAHAAPGDDPAPETSSP
jgi:outer membrane lipoprotein SlyB